MKALRWDKVITFRSVCIVQYRIIFSFHLATRISHPDPDWDRKVRYCSLFYGDHQVFGLGNRLNFAVLSELSRIIRETPDFGSCLPVSRLESETSLIINEVYHLLQTWHSNHKILNIWHCLSYFTANMERFLTNSGLLSCKLSNNLASYGLFYGVLRRSVSTIAFCTNDIMCHAIWCHLLSLPY